MRKHHWRRVLLVLAGTAFLIVLISTALRSLRQAHDQQQAIDHLMKAGGVFRFEYSCPGWLLSIVGNDVADRMGMKRAVSLRIVGTHFPHDETTLLFSGLFGLHFDVPIADEKLVNLRHLKDLEELTLRYVSDEAFLHLAEMRSLRVLRVSSSQLTDAGLARLREIPHLKDLRLNSCQVTGTQLDHLKNLTELKGLSLNGNKISDAELVKLHRMKHLEWLNLESTRVTSVGISSLEKALPTTNVYYSPHIKLQQFANTE